MARHRFQDVLLRAEDEAAWFPLQPPSQPRRSSVGKQFLECLAPQQDAASSTLFSPGQIGRGSQRSRAAAAFLETVPAAPAPTTEPTSFHGKEWVKDSSEVPTLPAGNLWVSRVMLYGGFVSSSVASLLLSNSDERATKDTDDPLRDYTDPVASVSDRMFSDVDPRDSFFLGSIPTQAAASLPGGDDNSLEAVWLANRKFDRGVVTISDQVELYDDYMPVQRPFMTVARTTLDNVELWQLQCQVISIFTLFALFTMESANLFKSWLLPYTLELLTTDGAVLRMDAFVTALNAFNSFFLGLFTSLTLANWDAIWNSGIENIMEAGSKLSQAVAAEAPESWRDNAGETVRREEVLDSLQRWTQASLHILFSRYGRKLLPREALRRVEDMELLKPEERALLEAHPHRHEIGLWSWIYKCMKKLQGANIISSSSYWDSYVHKGMGGTMFVASRMRRQSPFGYITLISMAVKMSNLTSGGVFGVQFGRSIIHQNVLEGLVDCLMGNALPLLMNSVIMLNAGLANPLAPNFTSLSEVGVGVTLQRNIRASSKLAQTTPELLTPEWLLRDSTQPAA